MCRLIEGLRSFISWTAYDVKGSYIYHEFLLSTWLRTGPFVWTYTAGIYCYYVVSAEPTTKNPSRLKKKSKIPLLSLLSSIPSTYCCLPLKVRQNQVIHPTPWCQSTVNSSASHIHTIDTFTLERTRDVGCLAGLAHFIEKIQAL